MFQPKNQLPVHVLCLKGKGSVSATLSMLLRSGSKEMRLITDKVKTEYLRLLFTIAYIY